MQSQRSDRAERSRLEAPSRFRELLRSVKLGPTLWVWRCRQQTARRFDDLGIALLRAALHNRRGPRHQSIMHLAVRALAAALLVVLPATLIAQGKFPPDSLVNVRVIAKDTPVREVVAMMRGWTGALGVRCTHCHVGEDARPLNTYDFASDEKRPKQVARVMLQMANAINTEHLSEVPAGSAPTLRVGCETCHRGVARPERIEQIIGALITTAGVDSAVRAYRGLMGQYEHRGSYNFTDAPLSGLAQQLSSRKQFDDALALLTLNEDTHKGSPDVPLVRGDVLLARGDTAAAIDAYQVALQRAPNGPARFRLRELGRQ